LDIPDPTKVKCYGPGLEHAFIGSPAEFTIETKKAGPGNLGLTIEGPEEAKIDCKDNGDGTCAVTYYPTQKGLFLCLVSDFFNLLARALFIKIYCLQRVSRDINIFCLFCLR